MTAEPSVLFCGHGWHRGQARYCPSLEPPAAPKPHRQLLPNPRYNCVLSLWLPISLIEELLHKGSVTAAGFIKMGRMLASLLLVVAALTRANAINVVGITYDLEKLKLQEVLHLNTSEFKTEPVLHVDIEHFPANFDTVGASVMKPWEYVVLTGEGNVFYSQVISLKNKTSTKPVPLMNGQDPITCYELHCSSNTCFCVDLTLHRFVSLNPYSGNVTTVIDFAGAFSGLVEYQSAFDRRNLVGYYVLADINMDASMYVVNFRTGEWAPVADGFYNNNTEAYCFDDSLGLLIGTGHPEGGIVAFEPSSNSTTVLLQRDLWGITESPPACAFGELLVQIVDW
jgi:hypothetical protein